LRWLSRENPDIGNARNALGRVLTAGHRARDIVANVCAMFKKDTQEKMSTDVNQLSRTVLTLGYIDLRKHSIECQVSLSEQLRSVMGNELQLQQVILNLIMNAIESMKSAEPRVLSIKSESTERDSIRVSTGSWNRSIKPRPHF
jgi:C4-dicarboxylate-specific signal transduction histidine kinase